ncbi:hypothetical protein [Archangium lipolyticum]|uniref:hypothetical protein n=1 Tax=Archangium lipolyticum TaxID=2970465 RepID=UPI00214A8532|nr:hypothetical protein [Archangium lipolyticum]
MSNRSPSRVLARPALLLPLLSLACNNPPPVTTPDPPQVSIIVDEPSTVGTSLKLSVSTSGCDQVQRVDLLDNNELLKQVAYAGNPTPVVLGMSEIRYSRGIAATLSLTARVTCADGRTNVSQAQPATFLPVAEVVEPTSATDQVVPDLFIAEGRESQGNVAFIGCAQEGNGRSGLYKVPRSNPDSTQRVEMIIPCARNTNITDRRPASTGWRWVWTPNTGFFSVSPQFTLGTAVRVKVDRLTVLPNGDALVWDEGEGGTPKTLARYNPAGTKLWELAGGSPDASKDIPGFLIGEPVDRGDGTIAVPVQSGIPGSEAEIMVGLVSSADGRWTSSFSLIDTQTPFNAPAPAVALDSTGTRLYMATQGTSAAYVRACAITGIYGEAGRCDPPTNRKWISPDLTGQVAALVPYASGTRLAVIATNRTWFLDTATGQVVNKDKQPLSPTGALVAQQVLPGLDQSFYLFTSGVPTESQPIPYPVEIIATDGAEKGEVFRYQVPGGSIAGATDDAGTLWLRVGRKLVKPLSLEQYRQVR